MSAPKTDRDGIQQVMEALSRDGWKVVGVQDYEDDPVMDSYDEALTYIMDLDEARLLVARGHGHGWVYFVLGNDPEEVVSDYTLTLSHVLDDLTEGWWA